MTYGEAIEFLYSLRMFGAKMGLQNTFRLAELAGNPQERLRFVHVAGTNGKGSTCAMLESIYRAAGAKRVGLFTSPHLVAFSERIQVNRQPIPEAEVARLVEAMRPLLAEFHELGHPTFFEVVTVMALRHFAEQECDLVIWETGLGGRLDATNIVTPLASVITNIQYDHQQWLGDTLTAIAHEKAGIIKPGVPVITAAEGEALEVISARARALKAPLNVVRRDALPEKSLNLGLAGEHQRINAAVAMATVEALQGRIRVDEPAIEEGLATVHWPGRMQRVHAAGGQELLLDGAHNRAGIEALAHELERRYSKTRPAVIFGVLSDKDWPAMAQELGMRASWLLVVPVKSQRGLPPADLAAACRMMAPEVNVTLCGSLAEALKAAEAAPLVVLTGSLYLVGEAMELLGLSVAPSPGEHSLNEYQAQPGQSGR